VEIWDLWYPNAAAQGLSFCRARIDDAERVLVHAAPPSLRVEVRSDDGALLASGDQLDRRGADVPMTRLLRRDGRIEREDAWPAAGDIGAVVLFAGGEAGVLRAWWHAADHSEWRWSVEFYNRR
jgi:hypothetical protein